MIMQAEDRIAGETIEKPIFDHGLGPATLPCFLGGLEDQVDRAVEMTRACQIFGCTKQHRRMAVMSAGVHFAVNRAGMGQARRFLDGQGIHIGAYCDTASANTLPQLPDNAEAADIAGNLVAPALQVFGDIGGRFMLLERQFRMCMQMPARLDELGGPVVKIRNACELV